MNNINEVALAGYMIQKPVQVQPRKGSTLSVEFELSIERERSNKHHKIKAIANDNNAAVLMGAVLGSYIIVNRATLVSSNYIKEHSVVCGHCHRQNILELAAESITPVVTGQIVVIDRPRSKSLIGNNEVRLMGNITNNPADTYFKSQNDHTYTQIKVASDRPRYKLSPGEQTADFIFVNAFSKLADTIKSMFEKGNLIYVKGYLQEREIMQSIKYPCSEDSCGGITEVQVKNVVREVVMDQFTNFPDKYQVKDTEELEGQLRDYEEEYSYVESATFGDTPSTMYSEEDEDDVYGAYSDDDNDVYAP